MSQQAKASGRNYLALQKTCRLIESTSYYETPLISLRPRSDSPCLQWMRRFWHLKHRRSAII